MSRVRLMIDFKDLVGLKEWVTASYADGTIPPDARVYECDGLDFRKGSGGITPRDTYILRNKNERPDIMELDLTVKVTRS